ncbi:hypothetical protein [Amorphus sp. 3PC139-8]|uniref:hypothetical protein n=1 Tax=Amorphus sp. 3PC139-8 TaxID=2735676 RepID=UPI00345D47E6
MKRSNETPIVATVLAGAVLFTAPLAIAESFRSDRLGEAAPMERVAVANTSVKVGSVRPLDDGRYEVTVVNPKGQALAQTEIGANETVLMQNGPAISARAGDEARTSTVTKKTDRLTIDGNRDVASKEVTGADLTIEAYQPRAERKVQDNLLRMARFGEAVHQKARTALDTALNWI